MNPCPLCHSAGTEDVLFLHPQWRIIAIDDEHYPGYCRIIWHEHVAELSDLARQDQLLLWQSMVCLEEVLREVLQPDKINWASFGNKVPHLHWHCIPRFAEDMHFPESILEHSPALRTPGSISRRLARACTPRFTA